MSGKNQQIKPQQGRGMTPSIAMMDEAAFQQGQGSDQQGAGAPDGQQAPQDQQGDLPKDGAGETQDTGEQAPQDNAPVPEIEVRSAARAEVVEDPAEDPYQLARFSEPLRKRITEMLAGQDVAAISGLYALLDYSLRMAPGRGFSGPEEGARFQVGFYRAFVGVLNTELLNFRMFFGTALAIVDELKEGAFLDPLPFRFLPQMNMDLHNRENFSALMTLLMNVSSVEQRKNQRVLAHLDLNRGLRGLNQNGRDAVKAFLTA